MRKQLIHAVALFLGLGGLAMAQNSTVIVSGGGKPSPAAGNVIVSGGTPAVAGGVPGVTGSIASSLNFSNRNGVMLNRQPMPGLGKGGTVGGSAIRLQPMLRPVPPTGVSGPPAGTGLNRATGLGGLGTGVGPIGGGAVTRGAGTIGGLGTGSSGIGVGGSGLGTGAGGIQKGAGTGTTGRATGTGK